jgi:hypothetical protein
MTIFDLFSKRQRRLRGEVPDVYVYDKLASQLRVQVVHIIRDAVGEDHYGSDYAKGAYKSIHDALCREYGLFELTKHAQSHGESVFNYFLNADNTEQALDVIELALRVIDTYIRKDEYRYNTDRKMSADDAISELNQRFKEHGVGFQFESGELLRVDSQFMHSEAVKPALAVLRGKHYKGASEEFLKAHEHYRHGRHKECLVESLKAFESTMKAICQKRKWPYQPSDSAKALIDICLSKGLIPSYLQSQFSSLRGLLESGVPTVRNKLGGHGQGSQPTTVPEHTARYALNLTATNILFLTESEQLLP